MIRIAEWIERYEVSLKGSAAKEGDGLRAGPLKWVRLKVHGHAQGIGYRRLKQAAGPKTMEVFGMFCKFLEIAGDQPRDRRGDLLNERDNPATHDDLAFILDVPVAQITYAVQVLSKIGCIAATEEKETQEEANSTQVKSSQEDGLSRKVPGIPDIARNDKKKRKKEPFRKPTIQEIEEYAATNPSGHDFSNFSAEYFWDYCESKGWKRGSEMMKDWQATVRNARTWESCQKDNTNARNDGRTAEQDGSSRQPSKHDWKAIKAATEAKQRASGSDLL